MTSTSLTIAVDYPRAGLLRPVTQDELEGFDRDGAFILRDIIHADWVEFMREAVARMMANPSPTALDYAQGQGPQFFTQTWGWLIDEGLRALVLRGPARDIAVQVLAPTDHVNLVMDQIFVKEAGTSKTTPWHQDYPYGNFAGDQVVRIWMPLDEVTADSGAVHYLKGSHRWGRVFHPVMFLDPEASARQETPWERPPDFDAEYDRYDWLVGECKPGDAILHHQLTVHGGPANTSTRGRRAVTVNYASAEVTWEPRPFTGARMKAIAGHVPFPRLQPGGPIESELYPRVWPEGPPT